TGFAFNLLNLLFAMPDTLEQAAHPGVDILISAAEQHDYTAYNLARHLRNCGLSVCTHLGVEPALQQLRKFHCRTLISIDIDGEKARIFSPKTQQTRQSTVTALLSDPVDM
ncbi:MAG: hypothetical protein WC913_04560, partial [Desulfuromonas sp.]